ncbi:MAG: hypothetical protein GF355_17010 [Candidatus Eisenbacteria bacterium]|nr:hypothetical protein [Candidatus Eisenbacteria bacterium]
MRFGQRDEFWLVIDPKPESEIEDIMGEVSLHDLALQLKGGLTMAENPTIFTDEHEAYIEGHGRLMALRAAEAIARSEARFQDVTRLELLDADGKVVFETELPKLDR